MPIDRVGGGAGIVIDSALMAVCCGLPESAACTVKLYVPPDPVGVPEIRPVPGVRVQPGGSEPSPETSDQVYGVVPPVAAAEWL